MPIPDDSAAFCGSWVKTKGISDFNVINPRPLIDFSRVIPLFLETAGMSRTLVFTSAVFHKGN